MRRSDSTAQRGTSISRQPRPVAAGPPWPPGPTQPLAAAAARAERRLLTALRDCGTDPRIAGAARVLGQIGEHSAVWMAAGAAGALADGERRRAWLRATAVVGAAHGASMGVKRLVRRPRPRIPGAAPLVRTAGLHSFPSSHATSSAAAVIAFGALLPGATTVPFVAGAICVSRLVAGVHHPSDVACGALLGAAAGRLGRTWSLTGRPPATPRLALPLAAAVLAGAALTRPTRAARRQGRPAGSAPADAGPGPTPARPARVEAARVAGIAVSGERFGVAHGGRVRAAGADLVPAAGPGVLGAGLQATPAGADVARVAGLPVPGAAGGSGGGWCVLPVAGFAAGFAHTGAAAGSMGALAARVLPGGAARAARPARPVVRNVRAVVHAAAAGRAVRAGAGGGLHG
ncbi:phosphatase PAP2 family protein [Streptomyces sp. NPDC049040]|uniref:phosphatase PAP2 family protein n=1 Tax=Streptomyces sp. NPDC049040 TaxID=3365593 RepID=UPI0037231D09